jgi:myb proto-oncogene protein
LGGHYRAGSWPNEKKQCLNRWHTALVSIIDPTTARKGKWTVDEDKQLKGAVPAKGDKNWVAISAQVPGRTKVQCRKRWCDFLVSSITPAARAGKWKADEDKKLKNAVPTYGDKNWAAISAQVPGRTKVQCRKRWWDALVSSITPAARAGKWKT